MPGMMQEEREYGHTTRDAGDPAMLRHERAGGTSEIMIRSAGSGGDDGGDRAAPTSAEPPETTPAPVSEEASTIEGMSPEEMNVAAMANASYTDADERQLEIHGSQYIRNMSTDHSAVYTRDGTVYMNERGTAMTSGHDWATDGQIILRDMHPGNVADKDVPMVVGRQSEILDQFDRVRKAYPRSHITLSGHSLGNNLISHVLYNRPDRNISAIGFNGLPHRAFAAGPRDPRYKHFHSPYDPVSYDPATVAIPNSTTVPYDWRAGVIPHSVSHFLRAADRKRAEENASRHATTQAPPPDTSAEADAFGLLEW
jgi:hypothetical protein